MIVYGGVYNDSALAMLGNDDFASSLHLDLPFNMAVAEEALPFLLA